MAPEPFIDPSKRPDLTIDLESRVGDLTVRQLSEILGQTGAAAKVPKDLLKEKELPSAAKEGKDPLKEHKDPKDTKDHKDPKDQKDQKDPKEQKDLKDQKDHKNEHKEQKDFKDIKDHHKEDVIDKTAALPESPKGSGAEGSGVPTAVPSGLSDLIQRLSRLEQDVAEMKKGRS